jgi:catechol 2,3-dioxygenase
LKANSIHPETTIGQVALRVRDLARSIEFYTNNIGLELMAHSLGKALLGTGNRCLVELHADAQAKHISGTAGLYHFAVLVPSRVELAKSLRQLIDTNTRLQGFADHLVSEAIYLADPDGNGIELYRDRPRDQWPRANGQLQMATDPLDVKNLLDELSGGEEEWTGLVPGTTIGHIHLQVPDLAQAIAFYQGVLGFDLVMRYGPSAAFLSAGGYHHHLGLNTWAGTGVRPAPPDAAGLIEFTIDLPDIGALNETAQRLEMLKATSKEDADGWRVWDPAGNQSRLRVGN